MSRKNFEVDKIKLTTIYTNEALYNYQLIRLDHCYIQDIYQSNLAFPTNAYSQQLPYMYASFVFSVDGKIAFKDTDKSSFISTKSGDYYGAIADFWILNLLRAHADAIIISANILNYESNMSAQVHDQQLVNIRVGYGYKPHPVPIIVTQSGKSLNLEHAIFTSYEQIIISTSLQGYQHFCHILPAHNIINANDNLQLNQIHENILQDQRLTVVISGLSTIDNRKLLTVYKKLNLNFISVEASYYTHALIKDQLLNEIFANYSGIYLGGDAINIAHQASSFRSYENIPQLQMLNIHMHSDQFLYTRQKFKYNYIT